MGAIHWHRIKGLAVGGDTLGCKKSRQVSTFTGDFQGESWQAGGAAIVFLHRQLYVLSDEITETTKQPVMRDGLRMKKTTKN